jgi:hypothetical protein
LAASNAEPLNGENGYMAIGQTGHYIVIVPVLIAVLVVTSSNWQPNGTKLALSQIIDKYVIPALQKKNVRGEGVVTA